MVTESETSRIVVLKMSIDSVTPIVSASGLSMTNSGAESVTDATSATDLAATNRRASDTVTGSALSPIKYLLRGYASTVTIPSASTFSKAALSSTAVSTYLEDISRNHSVH